MYSENDYRYYLEHRMQESDDFLMHYGVKGMKWREHKVQSEEYMPVNYNDGTILRDKPRARPKKITGKGKKIKRRGKVKAPSIINKLVGDVYV